jgi:hypothetical protein
MTTTNNVVVDLTSSDPNAQISDSKIDYSRSDETFVGIRFIMECSKKLEIEAITIATACTLFHNFFKRARKKDYDQYVRVNLTVI